MSVRQRQRHFAQQHFADKPHSFEINFVRKWRHK